MNIDGYASFLVCKELLSEELMSDVISNNSNQFPPIGVDPNSLRPI